MKKILLVIILQVLFLQSYGQSHDWFAYSLSRECECPGRIISTDSVYSFLYSNPLSDLLFGRRVFGLDKDPIDKTVSINYIKKWEILKEVIDKRFRNVEEYHNLQHIQVIDSMISGMAYYNARVIPLKPLAELLTAALDTTVAYTQPVTNWDISRLGNEWIFYDSWKYLEKTIDKNIDFGLFRINTSYEDAKYNDGLSLSATGISTSVSFISMSMPVFDKDYNYAMVFMELGLKENFYLGFFKRTEKGWGLLFIEYRFLQIEPNFSRVINAVTH